MSITNTPLWPRLQPYLFVIRYDKDGGHDDPRIRIEFRDLPDPLSREAAFMAMPCVTCGRPIYPLRRREGDSFSRLYYAPTCQPALRVRCSRSASARIEYESFKEQVSRPPVQLMLFPL